MASSVEERQPLNLFALTLQLDPTPLHPSCGRATCACPCSGWCADLRVICNFC